MENHNRDYVGKCKNLRKKKRKGFYGNSTNISAKSNFTPTNSTAVLSKTSSVQPNNTANANIVLVLHKR